MLILFLIIMLTRSRLRVRVCMFCVSDACIFVLPWTLCVHVYNFTLFICVWVDLLRFNLICAILKKINKCLNAHLFCRAIVLDVSVVWMGRAL